MTDQEIEKLAFERFPVVNCEIGDGGEFGDVNWQKRNGFIEGAKAIRDRFKQDIIEAYREGFTSTESAEQYYERRYNGQG